MVCVAAADVLREAVPLRLLEKRCEGDDVIDDAAELDDLSKVLIDGVLIDNEFVADGGDAEMSVVLR